MNENRIAPIVLDSLNKIALEAARTPGLSQKAAELLAQVGRLNSLDAAERSPQIKQTTEDLISELGLTGEKADKFRLDVKAVAADYAAFQKRRAQ
jgi:hypothetical protein